MRSLTMMTRILGVVGVVGAIACGCTDWDYKFCQSCIANDKTAYECNYSVSERYYDVYSGLWLTHDRAYRLTGCYEDAAELEKVCADKCESFEECYGYAVTEFYCDGVDDCEPSNESASAGASGSPSCGDWAPADAISVNPTNGSHTIDLSFWAGLLSDVSLVTCDATLVVPTVTAPGYSLTNIDPGSFADALGLQDGDVLVSLDGQPLTTEEGIRDAVVGLSNNQAFQLVVSRSGSNVTLDYTVQ